MKRKKADWEYETGNWQVAADLYKDIRDYKKAIDIYGQKGDMANLIELCRLLNKSDNAENIVLCSQYFKKNASYNDPKEAILKLGDIKSLLALMIEFCKWDESFLIVKENPFLKTLIKIPYAEWLCKNDRFEEALKVYKSMDRPDLSTKILRQLSENATIEGKFKDAAYFFWILATENLGAIKNAKSPSAEDKVNLDKFYENSEIADIYYAYSLVNSFIDEPFQSTSGITYLLNIFNVARYILMKMKDRCPVGIKKVYIYYALAKVARLLESFKTARLCYEKLAVI